MKRALLLALIALPLLAHAQDDPGKTPPAPTSKRTGKRAPAKTINVVGEIVTLDAEKNKLQFKPSNGTADLSVFVPADAELTKEGKPAKLTDYKAGDTVAVRLSVRPDTPTEATLKLLRDAATAAATKKVTMKPYVGTVAKSFLTNLDVKRPDGVVTSFRVNDKTAYFKDSKPVKASDYKENDPVAVMARSLPSGSLQALFVAESAEAVQWHKNDAALTWTGQITKNEAGKITLKRDDGATRNVRIQEGAQTALGALKAGARVHLHLVKGTIDADGQRTADKATNAR